MSGKIGIFASAAVSHAKKLFQFTHNSNYIRRQESEACTVNFPGSEQREHHVRDPMQEHILHTNRHTHTKTANLNSESKIERNQSCLG
jgi:hypothetical protein